MELLAQIPLIGGALAVIVPFLIVLAIVVFVHEYGHYIVGRWCGIKAQVFSIGFGKPLWSWRDRRGTVWQIASLPLGGFVKFVGDMDPASAGRVEDDVLSEEDRKVAFHNAGLLPRTLTVAAGPFANFLLSVVVFAGLLMALGQPSEKPMIGVIAEDAVADIGFQAGDRVLSVAGENVDDFADIVDLLAMANGEPRQAVVERDGETREITVRDHGEPVIMGIKPGMPAARAGLLAGDVFVSIDGEPVRSYRALQLMTAEKPHGAELELVIMRDGKEMVFRLVPELQEREHPVTREVMMVPTMGIDGPAVSGIGPARDPVSVLEALHGGVKGTWRIISGTMVYVGDMIFKGADTSQLGGPIRIAEISGNAAEQGFSQFIYLIALLSTSIGLINLFPIPILDGGHLMFYALELVRGRPVGETWMKVGTVIGLSLVLLLMVFVTYNDLLRLL